MENVHDIKRLKELQALPLERKIMITQARIIEWYSRHQGQVYVSFSGGKDSTVLLDIARKCFPDIPAVFCDTGLEYPEIRQFVKTIDNVTIIRPKKGFKQVILEHGYPIASKEISRKIHYARKGSSWAEKYINGEAVDSNGKPSRYGISKRWQKLVDAPFEVHDYCCYVIKKQPFAQYHKETKRKPIVATMAIESNLRTQSWLKSGCNSFDGKKPMSKPMSFWTEQDVLQYIKRYNIPYASVYGDIVNDYTGEEGFHQNCLLTTTGCKRTGCMFCMFGCHLEKEPNRFQKMKETHPKQYEFMLKPVEQGGLGMKEVLDYIEVPYE